MPKALNPTSFSSRHIRATPQRGITWRAPTAAVGDYEQAAEGFRKTWEIAKWNNVAANNLAGTLISMDKVQEGDAT